MSWQRRRGPTDAFGRLGGREPCIWQLVQTFSSSIPDAFEELLGRGVEHSGEARVVLRRL